MRGVQRSSVEKISELETKKAEFQSKIEAFKTKITEIDSQIAEIHEADKQKELDQLMDAIKKSGLKPSEVLKALNIE